MFIIELHTCREYQLYFIFFKAAIVRYIIAKYVLK